MTVAAEPLNQRLGVGALLSLQREALRTLLQNGTGHLSLAIELEFEERPARILEAGLLARE